MPRQPRFLPFDNYFHIMNRGNNGSDIFTCSADYKYYLKKISELKLEHPFDLNHYCLMPTHIHLLGKIIKETDFSKFSKRLNLIYANYYKRNYRSIGHFWQGRFKSKLISNDIYLIQCGKYIELNPVRANITQKPEDYPWSSYKHYAYGVPNKLITDDIFYNECGIDQGDRQKKYRKLIIDQIVVDGLNDKKLSIGSIPFGYNTNRKNRYHIKNKQSPYRKSRI